MICRELHDVDSVGMHDSSMQSGCLIFVSLQLGLVKVSFNVGMPKTNTMYHILAFEVQCRF